MRAFLRILFMVLPMQRHHWYSDCPASFAMSCESFGVKNIAHPADRTGTPSRLSSAVSKSETRRAAGRIGEWQDACAVSGVAAIVASSL